MDLGALACMRTQEQCKDICWYFWKGVGDLNFVRKINLTTMLIEHLWWWMVNLFRDDEIPPNLNWHYWSSVGDVEGNGTIIIS
jgi:hypothetical protein